MPSSYSHPFQQTLPNSGLSQAVNPNPFSTNPPLNQFEHLKNSTPSYSTSFNSNPITGSSINPFAQPSAPYQPNPYAPSSNPFNNPASTYPSHSNSAPYPQNPMETSNNSSSMAINNPFNPGTTAQNPFSSHSNSAQFGVSTAPSYNQAYTAPNPFGQNLANPFTNKSQSMETNNPPPGGINPRPEFYGSSYGAPSTQIGNGDFNIGQVPSRTFGRGKKGAGYRNP